MISIRALIAAGGISSRMSGVNKLTQMLGEYPVIVHSVKAFHDQKNISQIVVVVPYADEKNYSHLFDLYGVSEKTTFAYSGNTRRQSVYNGLKSLSSKEGIVLIHDGARPLVTKEIIEECINAAFRYGACVACQETIETVKRADKIMFVEKTYDRQQIFLAQTPQAFKTELILSLHEKADQDNLDVTDDAMIAEHYGHNVKIVVSDKSNIKITTKTDLSIARAILADRD